jgi:alginate O-acetyltransferase complex protein AlgI
MIFNSLAYIIFLTFTIVLYFSTPKKLRWEMLIISSVIFYLISNYRFIYIPIVLIVNTWVVSDYLFTLKCIRKRNIIAFLGVSIDLFVLLFFKVIEDSTSSFAILNNENSFAWKNTFFETHMLVPIGVSYMVFTSISYILDYNSYRLIEKPILSNVTGFLLFFPKLLAGPIERSHGFFLQISNNRKFDNELFISGIQRIIWGMFLKIVIANRLSIYTSSVFKNIDKHSGYTILMATLFFTIELYADFSGYTDIALGSAQLFGFKLKENFSRPFLSTTITDFWKRWHISLTQWVNEFVYVPVVIYLRDWGNLALIVAILLTFSVVGIWHGFTWNFFFFGILQGIIISIEFLSRKKRNKLRKIMNKKVVTIFGVFYTFTTMVISIVLFNLKPYKNLSSFIYQIKTINAPFFLYRSTISYAMIGIVLLITKEVIEEYNFKLIKISDNSNYWVRNFAYLFLLILILIIGVLDESQFIYIQF